MSESFELKCEARTDEGKGASRRLRRAGMVPGVIYGAGKDPKAVQVSHNELYHHCENDAFFSHLLNISIDGEEEEAIMKDLQRHPYKQKILHFDLLRVKRGQKLRVTVPVHLNGEDKAPGVKAGGVITRTITEVDMNVLPRELPEAIDVDISEMNIGDTVSLSQLSLPESAELIAFVGLEADEIESHDQQVVTIVEPREEIIEDDVEEVAADEVPSAQDGDDAPAEEGGSEESKGDE